MTARPPFYPSSRESVLVIFDLRDLDQWTGARRAREAWGRHHSEIYALDNDHIVIEFRAAGATDLEASA